MGRTTGKYCPECKGIARRLYRRDPGEWIHVGWMCEKCEWKGDEPRDKED